MKAGSFAVVLAFCAVASAEPLLRIDKLTLKNGKEFSGVSVTEKRADGISIMHTDGTTRIKFEDLPEDFSAKLGGFDAGAAKATREDQARKDRTALAEIQRETDIRSAKAKEAKDRKALIDSSSPAVIQITQATGAGVLCRIAWFEKGKTFTRSKDSFGRIIETPKETVSLTGFSKDLHFVTGLSGVVDGQEVGVSIVGDGIHRYTTIMGAESSVRKWRAISAPVKVK